MTIGELLKKYRINLNLTLSEMSAGIVSTSYYSKVEKDHHRISAEDLVAILGFHSINLESFFSQLNQEKNTEKLNQEEITSLYYAGDIGGLKKIAEGHRKKRTEKSQIAIALVESCLYDLDETYNVSNTSLETIKEKIFLLPNWDLFKLTLYSNFISFYDNNTNQGIISTILLKDKEKFDKHEQEAIIVILLNFVYELVNEDELLLAKYYLKKVDQLLTPLPDLLFYYVIFNFYSDLIEYLTVEDEEKLKRCYRQAELLIENGYNALAQQLESYIAKKTSGT